jgi:hypothetical protein
MIWADFWHDMLKENTSLVHVDFSYNNLQLDEVTKFAQGL